MSNNDLNCPRCKAQHHPVECLKGAEMPKEEMKPIIACIIREMSIEPAEQCDKIADEIMHYLDTWSLLSKTHMAKPNKKR